MTVTTAEKTAIFGSLKYPREPVSLLKTWCKAFVFAENDFFQLQLFGQVSMGLENLCKCQQYHWRAQL